ncbi:MAG: 2-amino-4-hydroxy-6-hydroxymethyldihydropteridine diphosphokinase [Crocinitomicaceae bacterium]|nr:2-amino-4-hydroxy-6-hydroxymethyldihydropteridine diphosphokinase [Crocinitomicaceae bacterium]
MEELIHTVYLSLGSNLGNRFGYLNKAIELINHHCTIIKKSSIYETVSWGYDSQNKYLNCCILVHTTQAPHELLETLKEIERTMGRVKTKVYSDRYIDIDILRYDDLVLNEVDLTLPHPHLFKRDFVLYPLGEIVDDIELKNKINYFKSQLPYTSIAKYTE